MTGAHAGWRYTLTCGTIYKEATFVSASLWADFQHNINLHMYVCIWWRTTKHGGGISQTVDPGSGGIIRLEVQLELHKEYGNTSGNEEKCCFFGRNKTSQDYFKSWQHIDLIALSLKPSFREGSESGSRLIILTIIFLHPNMHRHWRCSL